MLWKHIRRSSWRGSYLVVICVVGKEPLRGYWYLDSSDVYLCMFDIILDGNGCIKTDSCTCSLEYHTAKNAVVHLLDFLGQYLEFPSEIVIWFIFIVFEWIFVHIKIKFYFCTSKILINLKSNCFNGMIIFMTYLSSTESW